jgi:hypothetical protein
MEAVSYGNAREVLRHAFEMIAGTRGSAPPPLEPRGGQLDLTLDGRESSATEES